MINIPLTLVVFSVVFVSSVPAQVIRSYEGLDRDAGDSLSVQFEISLNGGAGNADYLDMELTGGVSYRVPSPGQWLRVYPSVRIRRSGKQSVVHEWSMHVRHSYVFSDKMRTYAFFQIQADRSINLDSRSLIGGGFRPQIVRLEDGNLDIGVGLMIEYEVLASSETASALGVRGANLVSAFYKADKVEFRATGYYQPVMMDLKNYRVFFDTDVKFPITRVFSFVVSGGWRRNSHPPSDVKADDIKFRFLIKLTIK